MNVARSIFVRRGYLLTALAVAVLLAGFSGTAWAQEGTTGGVPITGASRFIGSHNAAGGSRRQRSRRGAALAGENNTVVQVPERPL